MASDLAAKTLIAIACADEFLLLLIVLLLVKNALELSQLRVVSARVYLKWRYLLDWRSAQLSHPLIFYLEFFTTLFMHGFFSFYIGEILFEAWASLLFINFVALGIFRVFTHPLPDNVYEQVQSLRMLLVVPPGRLVRTSLSRCIFVLLQS